MHPKVYISKPPEWYPSNLIIIIMGWRIPWANLSLLVMSLNPDLQPDTLFKAETTHSTERKSGIIFFFLRAAGIIVPEVRLIGIAVNTCLGGKYLLFYLSLWFPDYPRTSEQEIKPTLTIHCLYSLILNQNAEEQPYHRQWRLGLQFIMDLQSRPKFVIKNNFSLCIKLHSTIEKQKLLRLSV